MSLAVSIQNNLRREREWAREVTYEGKHARVRPGEQMSVCMRGGGCRCVIAVGDAKRLILIAL